jgi:hypothetical protein
MKTEPQPGIEWNTGGDVKEPAMPVISKFYGIVIRMLMSRSLDARFHAIYGDHEIIVEIWPLRIVGGNAPERVRNMVLEWAAQNQLALMQNWNRAADGMVPQPVKPLE